MTNCFRANPKLMTRTRELSSYLRGEPNQSVMQSGKLRPVCIQADAEESNFELMV